MVNLRKFLQEYSEEINKNNWGIVYHNLNLEVSDDGETGDFTRFLLLKCKINPLNHLDYVPSFYMYVGDDTNPQDIKITKIEIPEGVTEIMNDAFYGNKQFKEISLPSTLKVLGKNCFNNCPNVEKITYNGTWDDWLKNIFKQSNWYTFGWSAKCGVTCLDGEFDIFSGERRA